MNTYAIIGGTLWGNRGAEAMVVTTIGRVRDREPGASFLVMSYMPQRDKQLVRDPGITVVDATPVQTLVQFAFSMFVWLASLLSIPVSDALLPASVRALRGCRVLFDVSGISFHDGRLSVVGYNVMCVLPALLLKVPVIRLSQAMGPFENPLNRWAARWVINHSLHTFSRGRHTSGYLRTLKLLPNAWSEAADVAFAFRPEDSLTVENEEKVEAIATRLSRLHNDGTEIVAVVPSSLILKRSKDGDGDYVDLLLEIVRHLQGRGHHVLVVPNATRQGVDELRNNDVAVVTRLRQRASRRDDVNADRITYVDFDLNTASIRSLIQHSAAVITSRFHAMVAALALGVPPLVIGWSHKYEEVLDQFGCFDNAVDFSEAYDALASRLDDLLDHREEIARGIRNSLPSVAESSERQFSMLDQVGPRGKLV